MMGCRGRSRMAASGLLLALLLALALAVVSAMSLGETDRRRELDSEVDHKAGQSEPKEHACAAVCRYFEARTGWDPEECMQELCQPEKGHEMARRRRDEMERRRRDDDEMERRRRDDDEVERRRRDDDEVERRRRDDDVERRRRDDDVERRHRDEDVERRRRDDDEMERRHREEDVERRRRDNDVDDEHHRRRDSRRFGGELQLQKPREHLRTEGGHLRVWEQIRALEDSEVRVNAARITLHQRGMMLPQYSDSATVAYVEEGEGMMGLLTGFSLGENARFVRRGDVVAIPRGFAQWWYNMGRDDLRIVTLSDTTGGVIRGEYTSFPLAGGGGGHHHGEHGHGGHGGERLRSVLFGFDKDFLADAWDSDESEVGKVLGSQKGVGIIRAEHDVHREMERLSEVVAANEQNGHMSVLSEYVYNVRMGTPEIRVQKAGHLNAVNKFKLPILKACRMGLTHGVLEKDAMFAPHWSPTGHQVVHIMRGSAQLQIVSNEGEQLVSQKVREGDVYVIPRFFPAGVRAGNEGLEWISFYTTDMPYVEALAGKTSVLKNLPDPVAAAAFNIDMDRVRECKKQRLREAILLPPRGYSGLTHHDHANFEGSYLRFLQDA